MCHHLSDISIITTIVGDKSNVHRDGRQATSTLLKQPRAFAIDAAGNIYIADSNNYRILLVEKSTGIITTVAGNGTRGFSGNGGDARTATLSYPSGVAVDAIGNIYIADKGNHRVRMVEKKSGIIQTVAGTGTTAFYGNGVTAKLATLSYPSGVAVDASGNIYIADTFNHRIRMVNSTGTITTVAGGGAFGGYNNDVGCSGDGGNGTSATLSIPSGVAVDAIGNIYIADTGNDRVRLLTKSTGIITTVAGIGLGGYSGDGGLATQARLRGPLRVFLDASGNIFIADKGNHRVRMVTKSTGIITTVGGSSTTGYSGHRGETISTLSSSPCGIAVDPFGHIRILLVPQ